MQVQLLLLFIKSLVHKSVSTNVRNPTPLYEVFKQLFGFLNFCVVVHECFNLNIHVYLYVSQYYLKNHMQVYYLMLKFVHCLFLVFKH